MSDDNKQPGPDNEGGGNPWMKSLMIWVGILVALALFVSLFDGRTSQQSGTTIAYSQFLDKVEEGSVKDVKKYIVPRAIKEVESKNPMKASKKGSSAPAAKPAKK